jgi:hypothetical protein
MKIFTFVIISLCLLSCSHKKKINESNSFLKVVHYNIKELDSKKLNSNSNQLKSVKSVLSNFEYDLLSINEIQFDLPNVPNQEFKTHGENLSILGKYLGLKNYRAIFFPANTGKKAKKKSNGTYIDSMSDKRARNFADQDNFGIFPGQYSTGVLLKDNIEVLDIKVISSLKWKDFNPKRNLNKYRTAKGKRINSDITLFDKTFTDITAKKDEVVFHIILLHTVPAFHFGNKKSINYVRNADQLRFLEWYLSGETDINVSLKDFTPLKKSDHYIALGDWNTELSNKKNPGSKVLRNLSKKSNFWLQAPISHTNESPSFAPKKLQLQLDYISASNSLKIKHSGIYSPTEKREELGCEKRSAGIDIRSYFDREKKSECYARFSKKYLELKEASDHLPIWANLEVN